MKKLINNYKKWNPSILVIALILLFPLCSFLINKFTLDNDFWFLINTGKYILNNGFIKIEPFTIHAGLSFVPQQWLTCILFYAIYHNLGIYGMFLFVIICYVIGNIICYKLTYLLNENRKTSLFITLFVDILLISSSLLTTRPQALDFVFFLLELYILELFVKKGNKKVLYIIPVISLLISNLHSSMWMMIFVFLLPYYVEYIVSKIMKRKTFEIKHLIIVTVLSVLAGLVNPYGIEAITYLFRSYGVSNIDSLVAEMKPVDIGEMGNKFCFGIIAAVIFSFYNNKGKNILRYFLLTIGTIYLFLSHWKGFIYFIVILPIVLGYNFKNKKSLPVRKMSKWEKIIYSSIIVLFMTLILSFSQMNDSHILEPFANYLDKNASKSIKLFTNYDDGGYMEYRGYKSYIDPRAEVFLKRNNKKEDIFDEYYDLCNGNIDATTFLNKYKFDYLLIDRGINNLYNELKNNSDYEEVYSHKIKEKEKKKEYTYMKYLFKLKNKK